MKEGEDDQLVDYLMNRMPTEWRDYWCEAELCACMGCINRAGATFAEVSKEQWRRWLIRKELKVLEK